MSRLIDADALKEELCKEYRHFDQRIKISPVVQLIRDAPTIEPERKTGHWLRTGRNNVFGGFEVECSECGDTVMIMHIEDELYCRHCGAKMEEGEQE